MQIKEKEYVPVLGRKKELFELFEAEIPVLALVSLF
jgi:hypothetical protein